MTVGARLRELREAEGLTLEAAGEIAGTSKQSASQIEKGVTKVPGGLYLYKWSRHYGVGLEWLITGKGSPKQSQSQSARLSSLMMRSAFRLARESIEARGDDAHDFDPAGDDADAELLALALEDVLEFGIEDASDGDVLRFARKVNKAGGASGTLGSDRQDGAAGSPAGAAQAGRKGKAATGRRAR